MLLRPVLTVVLAAVLVSGCETSSSTSVSAAPTSAKCQVSLASPPMLDAGGGTGSLAITTQPECTWEVTTNVNWISSLSPASGQGAANVSFRVAANEGSAQRDGMLMVNGEQARVSQRAPCRYDVSPASLSMDSGGGSGGLNVVTASDCSWTAIAEAGWITITSVSAASGNGTIRFSVAPNAGEARSAAIGVGNQRSFIQQSGVDAPPPTCNATISPTSQTVGAAGGPGAPVAVTAASTCQWTARSGDSWITVTSGASGSGNGTVTFNVAANSGAGRTGTLSIAGRTFTVSQAGTGGSPPPPTPPPPTPPPPTPPASCSYSISPTSHSVPVQGGADDVSVSTTSACSWTAGSNAGWIMITSGASGTGNGRVNYSVLPNTGGSRSGTLTIAGQTFTVNQSALVCSYSISPDKVKVNASAGTGSTSVTTNGSTCTWTASSNDSWITVTSGTSGTGSGTVTFSYTQNTGRDRKGEISVAGRNFTVEQDEARRSEEPTP